MERADRRANRADRKRKQREEGEIDGRPKKHQRAEEEGGKTVRFSELFEVFDNLNHLTEDQVRLYLGNILGKRKGKEAEEGLQKQQDEDENEKAVEKVFDILCKKFNVNVDLMEKLPDLLRSYNAKFVSSMVSAMGCYDLRGFSLRLPGLHESMPDIQAYLVRWSKTKPGTVDLTGFDRMLVRSIEMYKTNEVYHKPMIQDLSTKIALCIYEITTPTTLSDYVLLLRDAKNADWSELRPMSPCLGPRAKGSHILLPMLRLTSELARVATACIDGPCHLKSKIFNKKSTAKEFMRCLIATEKHTYDHPSFLVIPMLAYIDESLSTCPNSWDSASEFDEKISFAVRSVILKMWELKSFRTSGGAKLNLIKSEDPFISGFVQVQNILAYACGTSMDIRSLRGMCESALGFFTERSHWPEIVLDFSNTGRGASVSKSWVYFNPLDSGTVQDFTERVKISGSASWTSILGPASDDVRDCFKMKPLIMCISFKKGGIAGKLFFDTGAPLEYGKAEGGVVWLSERLAEAEKDGKLEKRLRIFRGMMFSNETQNHHSVLCGLTNYFHPKVTLRRDALDYSTLIEKHEKDAGTTFAPIRDLLCFADDMTPSQAACWEIGIILLQETRASCHVKGDAAPFHVRQWSHSERLDGRITETVRDFIEKKQKHLCLACIEDDDAMLLLARIFTTDPSGRFSSVSELVDSTWYRSFKESRHLGDRLRRQTRIDHTSQSFYGRTEQEGPRESISSVKLKPEWRTARDIEQCENVIKAFEPYFSKLTQMYSNCPELDVLDFMSNVSFVGEPGRGYGPEKEGFEVLWQNLRTAEYYGSCINPGMWTRLGITMNHCMIRRIPFFLDFTVSAYKLLLGNPVGICDAIHDNPYFRNYVEILMAGPEAIRDMEWNMKDISESYPSATVGPEEAVFYVKKKARSIVSRTIPKECRTAFLQGWDMGKRFKPTAWRMHHVFSNQPPLNSNHVIRSIECDPVLEEHSSCIHRGMPGPHRMDLEFCTQSKEPRLCVASKLSNFLRDATEETLKLFVQFCTGSSLLPASTRIKLWVDQTSPRRLPIAMTCHNTIMFHTSAVGRHPTIIGEQTEFDSDLITSIEGTFGYDIL